MLLSSASFVPLKQACSPCSNKDGRGLQVVEQVTVESRQEQVLMFARCFSPSKQSLLRVWAAIIELSKIG